MSLMHSASTLVTREALKLISVLAPTDTWKPIPHYDLVHALSRQLAVRDIQIAKEEFAVAHEGMRLFGVLDLLVPGMNGGQAATPPYFDNSLSNSTFIARLNALLQFCQLAKPLLSSKMTRLVRALACSWFVASCMASTRLIL